MRKLSRRIKFFVSIVSMFVTVNVMALTTLPAAQVVQNLNQVIRNVKQQVKVPVLFPSKVPVSTSTDKYYASDMVHPDGNGYFISIDKTADCDGAKYCSIGQVSAQMGDRPQIYAEMNGPDLTVPVNLYKGQQGYFTPAHAEADYWPTQIELRQGNVLYRVSWAITDKKQEKQVITALANSMLQAGAY
jgi:hypothetical protein